MKIPIKYDLKIPEIMGLVWNEWRVNTGMVEKEAIDYTRNQWMRGETDLLMHPMSMFFIVEFHQN